MDILYFSVCFIALFASSFGQDPLEVTFENATKVDAVEGSKDIHFRCHLNRGAMYVLNNKVDIVHVDPVTSEETILSSAASLVEGKPEFYDVQMDMNPENPNSVMLDFTISTVRYQDDGKFKCHVHPGDDADGEEGFAERELVVHRPFSSLKLKMGDFDAIEDSPSDPLKIDHGDYKVACIAEGSNPATEDIHLSFHGVMLDHEAPVVTAMEGPGRKFNSEITGNMKIMVSNSGQELVCQAKDSTGQSKSVKLTVSVNVYDPVVSCNDTEAHLGQANPMLVCTVNYTGLVVDGYSYQIGDTGEIVKPGDAHPKNIAVTVSDVAPGIAVVSLDLHKAEDQYLDKNYYILIDMAGGHTSKESVRLSKKEGGNNNGNGISDGTGHGVRLTPAALLYVLMFVAAFWSSH